MSNSKLDPAPSSSSLCPTTWCKLERLTCLIVEEVEMFDSDDGGQAR